MFCTAKKRLIIAGVSACAIMLNSGGLAATAKACDDTAALALGTLTKDILLSSIEKTSSDQNTAMSPAGLLNLTNLLSHNAPESLKTVLDATTQLGAARNCVQDQLTAQETQSGPQKSFNIVVHQSSFKPTQSLIDAFAPQSDEQSVFTGDVLELPSAGLAEWAEQLNNRLSADLNGMIETPLDINDSTNFILSNLLVFKAAWKQTFDKALTQGAAFNVAGKDSIDVAMMRHEKVFVYFHEADGYTRVLLPFAASDYMLQLILPSDEKATVAWLKE